MRTVRVTPDMAERMLRWVEATGLVEADDATTVSDLLVAARVPVVKKEQTTQVVGELELVADASELGLRPGEWPEWIAVVDDPRPSRWVDNRVLFERGEFHEKDGELMAVTYHAKPASGNRRACQSGCDLTVLND